ncbi:hypothetical protein [Actinomyces sp. HMT 175]|uniref:hypothetical protein n=1 Tax=Actinomyces sp. HMT 175 TaxID=2789425 RepID=UPI0019175717|nr:hypothetical protein [Actinomyces sp. HMT 175]QQQ58966.1 hypothetical protein JJJ14_10790 [Actinomyces sp. HMT 175]
MDRDVSYRDKVAWSPLMLVVGAALQVVLLMVAFAVMLSVPALTLDALDSAQSVVGTVAWMNGLSSFVASLLAMYIVRRRLRSVAMLVAHSAIPAAAVSAVNIVPTYTVRGWISILAVIILATIAAVVSALVYALLLRREDYL